MSYFLKKTSHNIVFRKEIKSSNGIAAYAFRTVNVWIYFRLRMFIN